MNTKTSYEINRILYNKKKLGDVSILLFQWVEKQYAQLFLIQMCFWG